jgi:hypothetical protein
MTPEYIKEKIKHTAKLVPQSQRDLFIYEINHILDIALEEQRKELVSDIIRAVHREVYKPLVRHNTRKNFKITYFYK